MGAEVPGMACTSDCLLGGLEACHIGTLNRMCAPSEGEGDLLGHEAVADVKGGEHGERGDEARLRYEPACMSCPGLTCAG